MSPVSAVLILASIGWSSAEYTVTIYPEYLAQNGRSHFEGDRFDNHNGLDQQRYISGNKAIGTETGRWMNRDLNGGIYNNTPQNPYQGGYPDPDHFNSHDVQQDIVGLYKIALNAYGNDLDTVMVLRGHDVWPHWMDASHHGGQFPNNLDAAAELTSLMFGAIQKGTGGTVPPYHEVINEPDTLWKHVNWQTIIEYHKVVAAKLKAKFHNLKVGGPTYTGAINGADKNDFRVWKMIREFLDMSLYHLDFFSFHPYNALTASAHVHHFTGTNEARLVAIIDLIESYSNHKRGFSVPLITSEYGLGGRNVQSSSTEFQRWAYAYQYNSYMFTFLNHRGVMERAVAFLLCHDTFGFEEASLYDNNNQETFVAKGYRFWFNHFHYNHQFLRVDSQYDGAERTISPLALADPNSRKVVVLLHNYKWAAAQVKLNFHNNWIVPTEGRSTCIYVDVNRTTHYSQNQAVHLNNHVVTVPEEGTCFFELQTGHNFGGTPTLKEDTRYSGEQTIGIYNNAIQTTVNLPSSGNFHSAYLRFAVSHGNKGAQTVPNSVSINGHSVSRHYKLYDSDRNHASTLWDVIVYEVPTSSLKHGQNSVHLQFNQGGGYVSSVALLVNTASGGGNPVG